MAAMYLTDAETAFRDSAQGREAIAYAKSCFDLRSHFGGTRTWTDADEASVIRAALVTRDYHRQQIADAQARAPGLSAMAEAALRDVRDLARDSRNI